METIWAPWRLAYVTEDAETLERQKKEDQEVVALVGPDGEPGCFLCQAVAGKAGQHFDRSRHILHRTETTIAVLNLFPYNNGHLLIAPKRHCARLDQLTVQEQNALMAQITFWVDQLEQTLRPEGFNIGLNLGLAAGAGLPGHLHWHIVPRWNGDTNFMAALGSVKVIPQSLDALWGLLRGRVAMDE